VDAEETILRTLGEKTTFGLARPTKKGGGPVKSDDLQVTIAYFGAAKGRWQPREFRDGEGHISLGTRTGDLFINDTTYFENIPECVWNYELGGYPVIKKWLGYRQASRRDDKPLTLQEKDYFRQMVQRIAAINAMHDRLDKLYEMAAGDAFTIHDLDLV
jgi:hypothetical protein